MKSLLDASRHTHFSLLWPPPSLTAMACLSRKSIHLMALLYQCFTSTRELLAMEVLLNLLQHGTWGDRGYSKKRNKTADGLLPESQEPTVNPSSSSPWNSNHKLWDKLCSFFFLHGYSSILIEIHVILRNEDSLLLPPSSSAPTIKPFPKMRHTTLHQIPHPPRQCFHLLRGWCTAVGPYGPLSINHKSIQSGPGCIRPRGVVENGYGSRHRGDEMSCHTQRPQRGCLEKRGCLERDHRTVNEHAQQWETDVSTIFCNLWDVAEWAAKRIDVDLRSNAKMSFESQRPGRILWVSHIISPYL